MEASELIGILERGEDSKHQFKQNITNADSLAGEMVAFSNSGGGIIIFGANDEGQITGLTQKDIRRLNQLISNTATNNVRNPINPYTENIRIQDKLLLVTKIPDGMDKPYMDNSGIVWVKSGSDKRRVTSKEELRRLFQSSDLVHADEIPVSGTSEEDIDWEYFNKFYDKEYEENIENIEIPRIQLLENLNLAKGGRLNLAGLLLFGKNPEKYKRAFIVKAVYFVGNDETSDVYRDSMDIQGSLRKQYEYSIAFLKRNLRYTQQGRSVNSLGELEVPQIVLEELMVNALIHRDYFINAPIKLFIFDDHIEILSPGKLPNNLTVEHIKKGNSNIRNDVLTSFATKQLPYRGIGTGIKRALKHYNHIELINDIERDMFIVKIKREQMG